MLKLAAKIYKRVLAFFGIAPPVTQADFSVTVKLVTERDKPAASRLRYHHEANQLPAGVKSAEAASLHAHMKQNGFWREA